MQPGIDAHWGYSNGLKKKCSKAKTQEAQPNNPINNLQENHASPVYCPAFA